MHAGRLQVGLHACICGSLIRGGVVRASHCQEGELSAEPLGASIWLQAATERMHAGTQMHAYAVMP
jgi:hypothetical protein